MHIPESEISITFAHASGKGGQNVNKVATKVVVRWNVLESRALSDEQKCFIMHRLNSRITQSGDVVLSAESERSQDQNRLEALSKLNALVIRALHVPKARKKTKPTKASRQRRLENKQKQSHKKAQRRKMWD